MLVYSLTRVSGIGYLMLGTGTSSSSVLRGFAVEFEGCIRNMRDLPMSDMGAVIFLVTQKKQQHVHVWLRSHFGSRLKFGSFLWTFSHTATFRF